MLTQLCKNTPSYVHLLICSTDGGVINVLVRYEPLGVSCADTVFRFALICSITRLTLLLTEGSYIPEQLEGEVQVPFDLLCQQGCELSVRLPSSIILHLLHFHILMLFFCNPPVSFCHSLSVSLLLSYVLSFWVYFTASLCFPTHFFREGGTLAFDQTAVFSAGIKELLSSRCHAFTLIIGFIAHPAEKINHEKQHVTSYRPFFCRCKCFLAC